MPDQSEVIMGEMEETRKDLAEKLETLEKKVAGTVETVAGAVQTVENTVENVKESIQETVSTVTDKVQNTVQAVENTVESTVENVKSFFDVSHHVERHPWLMMGGSVLVGYLGGWLLTRRTHTEDTASAIQQYNGPSRHTPPPSPVAAATAREPEPTAATGESWLGKLGEHLAPAVDKLKGLALGTLFGAARDAVAKALPDAVKEQVTDVINKFTSDVGGQVIRDPLDGSTQEASASGGQAAAGR